MSGNGQGEMVNEQNGVPKIQTGTAVREEFGASEMVRTAETAGTAMAAQAKAAVEARYVIAMKKPRSWMAVRAQILDECKRPRFAQVARYRKPVGQGVEGPSIRFAEAALRCMTNVMPETICVFDDDSKRNFKVSVTDLESNLTYSQDIVVKKTVERSNLKTGQTAISSRTNSSGKRTYEVEATDDDLLNKQNALISKALRTLALRLLPGDILDEAMDQVMATQRDEDAKDPNAARKRMVDAFAAIGVKIESIADYLGHAFDSVTSDEMIELRALGLAIKEGEAKWADALDHKKKARESGDAPGGVVASLKDRIKDQAAKAKGGKVPHDSVTGEVKESRQPGVD